MYRSDTCLRSSQSLQRSSQGSAIFLSGHNYINLKFPLLGQFSRDDLQRILPQGGRRSAGGRGGFGGDHAFFIEPGAVGGLSRSMNLKAVLFLNKSHGSAGVRHRRRRRRTGWRSHDFSPASLPFAVRGRICLLPLLRWELGVYPSRNIGDAALRYHDVRLDADGFIWKGSRGFGELICCLARCFGYIGLQHGAAIERTGSLSGSFLWLADRAKRP